MKNILQKNFRKISIFDLRYPLGYYGRSIGQWSKIRKIFFELKYEIFAFSMEITRKNIFRSLQKVNSYQYPFHDAQNRLRDR